MPPKKAKLSQEDEDLLVDRVTVKISEQFDGKFNTFQENFARMEQVMRDLAAASKVARVDPPDTRGKKRTAQAQPNEDEVSTVQQNIDNTRSSDNSEPIPGQSSSKNEHQFQAELVNAADVGRRQSTQPPTQRPSSARQQTASDLDIELLLNDAGQHVNSNPWAAWLQNSSTNRFSASAVTPASSLPSDEPDLRAQVQQIIENTAHTLSAGTAKPGSYPFKYVDRGPEKRKIPINSVTLSEHLLGILRLVKDPKVDPMVKPAILTHLEEVIEDSAEFEWQYVRRWSEEIFSMVAEGRLPKGWFSTGRIQLLRMSMSRLDAARIGAPKNDQQTRRFNNNSSQQEQTNRGGGPPCPAFNSPSGCALFSGHMVNGRKMLHICAFCLYQNSATNHHSESQCRNKIRHGTHFQ